MLWINRLTPIFVFAAMTLASSLPAASASTGGLDKAAVEKIVHDYLLANPEVVREAIDELEKRQKVTEAANREKTIGDNNSKLVSGGAVIGNPDGDVTLIEFFDYNCGYCKRALADVAKLIEGDSKLRVVLRDFPILSEGSREAAQIAIAIRGQLKGDKYFEFHRRLLATKGQIGKAQGLAVAKELGVDTARLEKDMSSPEVAANIKETTELAEQLRFDGTPSWVLGKEGIVGGIGYAALKTRIDNYRKCGKSTC